MEGILDKFQNLGRYENSAPHKPILVLALLDWMEELSLKENKIPIDTGLFEIFEAYWNQLYDSSKTARVHYPIRYLQTDDLGWEVFVNGEKLQTEKSKSFLKKNRANATFDTNIWNFLRSPENRDLVRLAIINTYFPNKKEVIVDIENYSLADIEAVFFEPSKARYKTRNFKKAGYVRDSYFRLALLNLYNNTCAISKMHVNPPGRIIQACHISQFSKEGDNSVNNGIVLCANLHAAFDQGYIGIGTEYEVLINEKMFDEKPGIFNLKKLRYRKLILPENKRFWPSQNKLEQHRKLHFS
jgi:putative restriction endonuclease